MHERFIGEYIKPLKDTFDFSRSSPGEPAIPSKFTWRTDVVEIEHIVERWKTTSPCRHGSGEKYVRRHWYRVQTNDGKEMVIYFDRKPPVRAGDRRWWLFSIRE